ncbi:hypothetical protein [Calothrix sp. CCY 0018]|uniref:hypothetical protein n=1 Tax=Calothrix sp. CCY 0018 TaxID=3103864 RepID=UPI0039C6ADCD
MIPKPQRDMKGKVQGEFYPLQKAELIALRKAKLINNVGFVHLALRHENPFCDRSITVIPKEFARRWLLPESSVYEAIARLKESHAINIKSGRITIEWVNSQQEDCDDSQQESVDNSQQEDCDDSQQEPVNDSQQECDSENPEKFWESRKNSESPEKITESQKKFQNPRKNSGSSEKRCPQSAPGNDSGFSQTIQTYPDFIQTLSKGERESFLEFGKKKASQLPKPPQLTIKWIQAHHEELCSEWRETQNKNQKSIYKFEVYQEYQHQMWYGRLQSVVKILVGFGDDSGLRKFFMDDFQRCWYDWAKSARMDVRELLANNPIMQEWKYG